MLTTEDIKFAKKIIARQMISKMNMQGYLDALESILKRGEKISLEEYLLQHKFISQEAIGHLKDETPVLRCPVCQAMYRISNEDLGTQFKCKKCRTMILITASGQAQIVPVDQSQLSSTDEQEQQEIAKPIAMQHTPAKENAGIVIAPEPQPAHEDTGIVIAPEPAKPKSKFSSISQASISDSEKNIGTSRPGKPYFLLPLELMMVAVQETPMEDDPHWWSGMEDTAEEVPSSSQAANEKTSEVSNYLTDDEKEVFEKWEQTLNTCEKPSSQSDQEKIEGKQHPKIGSQY